MEIPVEIVIALIAAAPGVIALVASRNKTRADTLKTQADTLKEQAETDSIHAQVADRWAEHVAELQEREKMRDKEIAALSLDIAQVRRENETYRKGLAERDQIIADLKDWAERLISQLRQHAPTVRPEQFFQRGNDAGFYLNE